MVDPRKTIKDLGCAIGRQKGDYLKEEAVASNINFEQSFENVKQSCLLEAGAAYYGGHQKPNERNDILEKFLVKKKNNLNDPEFDLVTEENLIFQNEESCYFLDDAINVNDITDRSRLNRENIEQLKNIFAEEVERKSTRGKEIPDQGRFPIHKIIKKNFAKAEGQACKDESFYKYRPPYRSSSLTQRKETEGSNLRRVVMPDIKTLTDRYAEPVQGTLELEEIIQIRIARVKKFRVETNELMIF